MLKASFLQLTRQRIRTFLYFLVFLLTFSSLMGAYLLLESANASKASIMQGIGATVTLDSPADSDGDEPIFTQKVIQQLSTVDHVIGANQRYSDYATPVHFSNCRRFEGSDPATQPVLMELEAETADFVVLEGDSCLPMHDLFRQGHATLLSGCFPSAQQRGAILSQQLAEDAGLSVGDEFSLTAYGKQVSIPILGIYQTQESFTITGDNIVGEAVFAYSPYNRIYADLETAASFFGVDPATRYVTFYVDHPNNVETVGTSMKALPLDWPSYSLINTTQTLYQSRATQIEATAAMAQTMLVFLALIAGASVLLVTSIWGEQSRFESGILLALGCSKGYAFGQQLLTTLLVSVPACVLSLLWVKPFAALLLMLKDRMTVTSSAEYSQFVTGLEETTAVTIASLSGTGTLFCLLFAGCTILVSCFVPMWCILRMKPREILSNQ